MSQLQACTSLALSVLENEKIHRSHYQHSTGDDQREHSCLDHSDMRSMISLGSAQRAEA